jgi:hypothetical protein
MQISGFSILAIVTCFFLCTSSLHAQNLTVEGSVGIGTDTPSEKLQVENGFIRIVNNFPFLRLQSTENQNAGMEFLNSTGVSEGLIFYSFPSKEIVFMNQGAQHMFIEDSGRVGVGTNSPSGILSISASGDDVETLSFMEGGSTDANFFFESDFAGGGAMGNSLSFKSFWADDIMTFRGDGNVGINVSDAQADLHVNGNVRIDGRLDMSAGATNIFIGRDVAPSFSPQESVIIGERAGNSIQQNLPLTTLVGKDAGRLMTSGQQNTALGGNAAEAVTTESFGVYVGAFAGEVTGAEDAVFVGYDANSNARLSNVTAIGAHAMVTGSDRIALGNVATRSVQGYANFGSVSDARFKTNIREDVEGLAFIEKLRPVSYRLDAPKLDAHIRQGLESSDEVNRTGYDAALRRRAQESHIGFLAQDVEQAARELGFEFSGLITPEGENDHYGLRYAEFVVPLVKGMQEQQEDLKQKTQDIRRLEAENQVLQNRLTELESLVQQLLDQESEEEAPVILNQVPSLEQNEPNPFQGTTRVGYFLPAEALAKGGFAQLVITSVDGKELQRISLSQKGKGQVDLQTGNFAAGTYNYSLIVNGQVADTKRMIVQ